MTDWVDEVDGEIPLPVYPEQEWDLFAHSDKEGDLVAHSEGYTDSLAFGRCVESGVNNNGTQECDNGSTASGDGCPDHNLLNTTSPATAESTMGVNFSTTESESPGLVSTPQSCRHASWLSAGFEFDNQHLFQVVDEVFQKYAEKGTNTVALHVPDKDDNSNEDTRLPNQTGTSPREFLQLDCCSTKIPVCDKSEAFMYSKILDGLFPGKHCSLCRFLYIVKHPCSTGNVSSSADPNPCVRISVHCAQPWFPKWADSGPYSDKDFKPSFLSEAKKSTPCKFVCADPNYKLHRNLQNCIKNKASMMKARKEQPDGCIPKIAKFDRKPTQSEGGGGGTRKEKREPLNEKGAREEKRKKSDKKPP
eukprot:2849416-Rhodomonas_salina.1